jgi:hypothetical protein
MWGEERGIIPINQNSNFGLVTREHIRKFTYTWKGEWSISDIGRYTAVATLGYGSDGKKFTSAKTFFWVIPYKLLLGILISLIIFFSLVTWLVKIYVRHTLILAGIDVDEYKKSGSGLDTRYRSRNNLVIHSPLNVSVVDLKQRLKTSNNLSGIFSELFRFIIDYKSILLAGLLILLFLVMLIWYIMSANTKERGYEVVYVNPDASMTLNSEEIAYNKLKSKLPSAEVKSVASLPKLKIVNRSGVPGNGAKVRVLLENIGYEITSLGLDLNSPQSKTVIVYSANFEADALRLSSKLNNALASIYDGEDEEFLTVYVGDDIL